MLFSSITFLFYFLPVTLLVYVILKFSLKAQNIWLLIVSMFFYAWGEPLFVFLMTGSILINYLLGLVVDRVRDQKKYARIIIIAAYAVNLGILFAFKYLGFVIRNINALCGRTVIGFSGFALPLGISFFTFQAMSYVLDVYHQNAKVEKNPFYVGLYVSLFPQLVAGPIVRYADIAAEMRCRRVTWTCFSEGCCKFIVGMGKKVILSNAMAIVADNIFDLSAIGQAQYNVPVTMALLGIVSYTMQIYFDFSGYSDMAIGLGNMFGFHFLKNFDYPYISCSVSEFWRRWHISLSTWFREYVYFPLGGSRVDNNDHMIRNTFVVWLFTGIWHGAEWTFVVWGLWNLAFIIFERMINFEQWKIPKAIKHIYLLTVVGLGWMMFRAIDFYQATQYCLNVLGLNNNGFFSETAWMYLREYGVYYVIGIVCCTPIAEYVSKRMKTNTMGKWSAIYAVCYPAAFMGIFCISVIYLAKGNYNPFIYFNF